MEELDGKSEVVAAKLLKRPGPNGACDFEHEVRLVSHLRHENVITFLGVCLEGADLILIYEYMNLGNLRYLPVVSFSLIVPF